MISKDTFGSFEMERKYVNPKSDSFAMVVDAALIYFVIREEEYYR